MRQALSWLLPNIHPPAYTHLQERLCFIFLLVPLQQIAERICAALDVPLKQIPAPEKCVCIVSGCKQVSKKKRMLANLNATTSNRQDEQKRWPASCKHAPPQVCLVTSSNTRFAGQNTPSSLPTHIIWGLAK